MNVCLYPGVPFGSARAKSFLSSVQLLQRLSLALRETRGSLAEELTFCGGEGNGVRRGSCQFCGGFPLREDRAPGTSGDSEMQAPPSCRSPSLLLTAPVLLVSAAADLLW